MDTKRLPGGLWPVMLTPFLDNNTIDEACLQQLTRFYIDAGAHGLFSDCLSSEMFQLTDEERLFVNKTVVSAAEGIVPVAASGTFHASTEKNADFIKKVFDTGVAVVILITNQIVDTDEGEDIFKRKIEALLKLTRDIPLGTYECPYPYKRILSPDLIAWLGETGRFVYHKDTSCDPENIEAKLKVMTGTPFSMYNADTPTALMSLRNGAAGISPIGANFYPELYAALIKKQEEGTDDKSVDRLSAQLTLMDSVADQCYPFSAKLFLQKRAFPISTTCRIAYDKMKPDGFLKIQALMDIYKQTLEYIG